MALPTVMPPLLLGSATFNVQHVADPLSMPYRSIVSRALQLGIRAFDTSPYYGPAEILLGDALNCLHPRPPRESIFLVTKAGRIDASTFDYSAAYIRYSVNRSLKRLGTDYLDLVHLHDVEFVSAKEVLDGILTLRQLRDEGKIRFVGISGFPVHLLCDRAHEILQETGQPLDAVLSYGYHTIQNPVIGQPIANGQPSPLQRFKEVGVQVVLNASILGMGLLTQNGIPDSSVTTVILPDSKAAQIAKWHPAPAGLRAACRTLSSYTSTSPTSDRLEGIALRWALESYAKMAADAGLGVTLPNGQSIGASVLGVTTVDELEHTVREWNEVLGGPSGRGQHVKDLVEHKMWDSLGSWKGFAWKSPDEGWFNQRGDKTGTVPDGDELATEIQRRLDKV